MKYVECWNCQKLLFIDEIGNLETTPSSEIDNDIKTSTKINIRCKGCKKHNVVHD